MKLRMILPFTISVFLILCNSVAIGQWSNSSLLKIYVGDGRATYEMVFGNHVMATWGMGGQKDSLDPVFIEKESPPMPPGLGVVWRPARSGVSWGIGFLKYDIKDWTDEYRRDTFLLYFANAGGPDSDITLSWSDVSILSKYCTALTMKIDSVYYDMFAKTSVTIPEAGNNGISKAYLYKTGAKLEDVKSENTSTPEKFELYQNYPNPFNPTTTIGFNVLKVAKIDLFVYGITGEMIANSLSETLPPGTYSFTWNGMNTSNAPVASGVYFVRMIASSGGIEQYTAFQKIILVK